MHFRHAPWRCYGHHISCARLREFPLAPITNLFYRRKGYSKDDNKKHFDASVMMTLNKSVENPQQKTVLQLFQNCRHYIATVINGAFFEKKMNWPSNVPKNIYSIFWPKKYSNKSLAWKINQLIFNADLKYSEKKMWKIETFGILGWKIHCVHFRKKCQYS